MADRVVEAMQPESMLRLAEELIRSGEVSSRSELVSRIQVAPATASQLIKKLIGAGLVEESGEGPSTGGRRPKLLRPRQRPGVIAVAELGGRHARAGLCDTRGALVSSAEVPIRIEAGEAAVFDALDACWQGLLADSGQDLLAVGLALPGPVDVEHGQVVSPARMPGWSGLATAEALRTRFGVPAIVENDARAGAVGEWIHRRSAVQSFIYVKAGTGIGGAFIADGRPFRGAGGLAGDVTHIRVSDALDRFCSCGNHGCLESVASGAALRLALAEAGTNVETTAEIIDLARDSQPLVTTLIRTAGSHVGEVLAPLVNFLNPEAVVIGGSLSGVDAFVAAIRGVLYDRCLPMCTQQLRIETSLAAANAGLFGLGELARVAAESTLRKANR